MKFEIKHFNELSTNELYEILKTRSEIFVVHIVCWNDEGRVAACLRVFWKDKDTGVAQIGRVVTLEHGTGLGGLMLHEGVELAINKFGARKIYLEAQEYAIGYYAKEGFKVVSEPFLEDGIPHVQMEREITGTVL